MKNEKINHERMEEGRLKKFVDVSPEPYKPNQKKNSYMNYCLKHFIKHHSIYSKTGKGNLTREEILIVCKFSVKKWIEK